MSARPRSRSIVVRLPGRRALLAGVGAAWLALATPGVAQQAVKNPHGKLPPGLDCASCHTATNWHTLRASLGFDHAKTGFPLTGAHRRTACAQCHLDLHFDKPNIKPNDCGSCHVDVHEGRMVQRCSECHTTRSFKDVNGELIHSRTSFPLTGAHRQITCQACHTNDAGGAFTPLPTTCSSCHMADYRNAKSVNHVAMGYSTDCTQCHTTVAWQDEPSFNHARLSGGFQLVGAHARLQCSSCHEMPGLQPIFKVTSQNNCVACHQPDYDKAHSGSGFPTTCTSCHNVNTWNNAQFDHSSTGFPLVGAHVSLSCSACHSTSNNLSKLPTGPNDCVACHLADYNKAHSGSGFPTTCTSCHNQTSWGDANFNHSSTGFPLVGAHASLSCSACHSASNDLSKLPTSSTDCVACHLADYNKVHAGTSVPTTCAQCHSQTSWDGASADHSLLSNGFALTGAHLTAQCTACHAVPGYTLTVPKPSSQTDCVACHLADYNRAHGGSNTPTTCADCHNTTRFGDDPAPAPVAMLQRLYAAMGRASE